MNTPDEETPDGMLMVDIIAISHANRGNGSRGKRLRERWQLLYMLHKPDGTEYEGGRDIYGEDLDKFDACGVDIDWTYKGRQDLSHPIPVIFDAEYQLINVGQVEKAGEG